MEGYMNISGNHEDFDDLDIEGRITLDEWNCEDDDNTKEKAANDREEKRLLSIKVKLDDGGFGYVFSVKTASDHTVRWNCHLCDVLIIGQRHVETHIQSKKHQIKMALPSHPANLFKRIDNKPLVEMPTLAPGEPVPPGFEDVVKRITQIQATLDSHKSSPLIGLEYLVELTPDETGKEPTYVCMLCDKKGDPRVAMAHITSLSHRQKYIGIHFPTANKAMFNDLPRSKEGRRASTEIVNRICAKIEEKYGRLQPMVVEKELFETKKDQIMRQIQVDRHFRETPEETFVELVDISVLDTIAAEDADSVKGENKSEIDSKRSNGPYSDWVRVDPAEKISNEPVYHPPEIYLVFADPAIPYTGKKHKKKSMKAEEDVEAEAQQASSDAPHLYSPNTDTKKGAQMNLLPHSDALSKQGETSSSLNLLNRKRRRSTSPFTFKGLLPTPNLSGGMKLKWELYENELKRVKANLLKEKEFYEKNPEGHPKYGEEWTKFWTFCSDKLRKEGKNPVEQKIISEWIPVWKKIISDYYETSFQKMKDNLLQTYCIVGSVEGTKMKDFTENEDVKKKYQEKNTKEQSLKEAIEIICEIPRKEGSNGKSRRAGSHEKSRRDGSREKSRREKSLEKSKREGSQEKYRRERSRSREKYRRERSRSREKSRRERSHEKSRSEKSRREGSHDKSKRERSLEKSRREGSYDKSRRRRSLEKSRREGSYDKSRRRRSLEKSRREGSYDKSRRGSREKSRREDISRKEDSLDKTRREEGCESISSSEDESLEYSTKRKVINTGIVSVLRLLTALESQLGSLGHNVNELLSSALSLENISPTSSDALLANPNNFSLLETMKEKLRGQLLAGIVENNMVKATRKCIHDIEEVLTKAEKINPDIIPVKLIQVAADPVLRNIFPKPVDTPAGPCSVPMNSLQVPTRLSLAKNVTPRVDTLDKTEIAQKIAMALIALGRKDVTQTELEELIKNYILMSQSSNISMASFISSQQQKYQQQYLQQQQLQQCQQQYHHLHQQEQVHQLLQQQPLQKQENEIGNLLNFLKHTTNVQNTNTPNPVASLKHYTSGNVTAASQNAVDELTDGDITNLLLNFKVLPADERQGLINLIRRLQFSDPTRMDRLKKIVNFDNSYLAMRLNSSSAGMFSTSSPPYGEDSSVERNKEDTYRSSTQRGRGQNMSSLNEAKERVTYAMNQNIQSFDENKSLSSNLRVTTMKIQRCLNTLNATHHQHPGYSNSGNASNQYGHQNLFKNSQTDCEQGSNRFLQTTLKPESSQDHFMSPLRRKLH